MSALLVFLGMLLSLVAAGCCLSCLICEPEAELCTKGPTETCHYEFLCGGTHNVYIKAEEEKESYTMSCMPRSQCDMAGSASGSGWHKKMVISCCRTNGCIPLMREMPEDETEELNGQMCQTCVPADSDWCESTEAIDCTGHENRCLLVTKTEDNVTLIGSLSGCVTNSICDYYNDPENEIAEEGVEYTCSDGSLDLRICLYLPAAACLLILTLLL